MRSAFITETFCRSRVDNSAMLGFDISRLCLREVGRTLHIPAAAAALIGETALGIGTECAVVALTRTGAEVVVAYHGVRQPLA